MTHELKNLFFAWLPTVCILLLIIIYPLRIYCKSKKLSKKHIIFRTNKCLRKIHKPLGIITIVFTFIHCRFSSQKLGLNIGTICLCFLLVLFVTYIFRKQLKKYWLLLHRLVTVLLIAALILHILLT